MELDLSLIGMDQDEMILYRPIKLDLIKLLHIIIMCK